MQNESLEGEVAIVTGSSSGIGRRIAERFADEGANVIIADCNEEGGKETADRITSHGGSATFVKTDVSEASDVTSLVQKTTDKYNGVDILVNNAGGSFSESKLHQLDDETLNKSLSVNLKGQILCARETLPLMISSGGGSMIHMSSVNGLTGVSLPSYSAAKGGIISFSRVIATQYGCHDVRSNVICPGTIETKARREEMKAAGNDNVRDMWLDQYSLRKFGQPDDVADAALYLASDMSTFVTGTELVVDGGLTAGLNHALQSLVYDVEEEPIQD